MNAKTVVSLVMMTTIALCACASADEDQSDVNITGTYSDFVKHEESDDYLGIEVTIVRSGAGYSAVFQAAEGVPRVPIVVPVSVEGNAVSFYVHEENGYQGRYSGVVTERGLFGGFAEGQLGPNGEKEFMLERKCGF